MLNSIVSRLTSWPVSVICLDYGMLWLGLDRWNGGVKNVQKLTKQDMQKNAVNQIKQHILDMKMKSGDVIPSEVALSKILGISRPVVREALKSMEYLGMLDAQQGKGRFVREFNCDALVDSLSYTAQSDLKRFSDILDVRICLEVSFLLKDVDKFTDKDFRDLDNLLDEFQMLAAKNVPESELITINARFHAILQQYSENEFLLELIRAFAAIQRRVTASEGFITDKENFISCHRAIVEALKKKDSQLLGDAMTDHFSEPIEWVQRKLKNTTTEV